MATDAVRETFLRERRKGIGGSDVAAIFGLDRYRSPEDVWLEKTGQVIPINEPTGDKERGIRLEPIAAELFSEKYQRKLFTQHQTFVDREFPWMRGNIDRLIGGTSEIENQVAEIKCPSLGMYSKIKREGLGDSWKLQMQHYLRVTGLRVGVWIIFCADRWEMLDFPMERDEEVIALLVEKEKEFWTLVETMTPPPPVVREIKDEPEIVELGSVTIRRDDAFVEAMSQLREAKNLKTTAEQLEQLAADRVKELAGKPGIFESPGARTYFKEQPGRNTFDKAALARAKPLDRLTVGTILQPYLADGTLPESIIKQIGDANLDLTPFNKVGNPFVTLRTYFFGD